MFSKQLITISRSKDLFFRVHSENRKRSLIVSDAVAEITGCGKLNHWVCAIFNKRGGSNNRVVGEKFSEN